MINLGRIVFRSVQFNFKKVVYTTLLCKQGNPIKSAFLFLDFASRLLNLTQIEIYNEYVRFIQEVN